MVVALALLIATMPSNQMPAAGTPSASTTPWTLMVYGAADNNADGPILRFLDQVRTALDDDPGMPLVLFLDRSKGFSDDATLLGEDFTGARLYRLRKASAERLAGGAEFPEMTLDGEYEADSADPANLRKLIQFTKAHYPAERYALMIYSHANGETMCPDEETPREMGIAELTDVVTEAESVDFLALELCNMGGAEIAYQWRPGNGGFSADVLLAIPNAGPPLDWHRAFARIRSPGHASTAARPHHDPASLTPEGFAALVIEEGEQGRLAAMKSRPQRVAHEAAAAFDLHEAETVKNAVDALAIALARTRAKDVFEELRGPGPQGFVMNYAGDEMGPHAFVDLYALCVRARGCERLDPAVREAAGRVMEAVDDMVIASFGMSGYAGFEPGKHGVFILFPDGDETINGPSGSSTTWRACAWYTPLRGKDRRAPYGSWAWCRDGASPDNGEVENWFELLDSWFDPGTGPGNGYRP